MLHLRLIRAKPKDINQKFTHGELFVKIQGKWMDFCYTLEDQIRDINMNGKFDGEEKKVYGETAIPFNTYKGEITYSNAFEKDLPLIKDVPEFSGIRMHGGNNISHTFGCILVAHNTDNKGNIWGSAESDLVKLIKNNGNDFTIEIT